MRWIFIACCLIFAQASSGQTVNALDIYLVPQTLARLPDGRALHFFCLGTGSPIAILDAGWASWSTSWRAIQPEFAKYTKVCAVDRPGYGFSDPGPMPRDAAAIVADIRAGLQNAGLHPPYIFVGHSQSGFDARLFAYNHPEEISGLLLIDPPTERLYQKNRTPDEDLDAVRRCITLAKRHKLKAGAADDCVPMPADDWSKAMRKHQIEVVSKASVFETELSEDLSMVGASSDELVAARHSLGDMPLIVLQADMAADDPRSTELEDQVRDSTRGRHVVVKGARHYIQADKPDVVIAAFRDLLEAASAR